MMRIRHICAVLLCIAFAAAYAFAATRTPIKVQTEKEYSVFASFYPVYSISRSILEGVPGIRLTQLIQPTDNDISGYSLSDWDSALLERSDIFIAAGSGIEPFADYSNDHTIRINLISGIELLEKSDGTQNPWVFMSAEGIRQMAEALCANMITADESYTQVYIDNLAGFMNALEGLNFPDAGIEPGCIAGITHDSFEYLCRDAGVETLYVNDAQAIEQAADMGITTLFCDRAFISNFDSELSENGIRAVLLDTGMAHGTNDSKAWMEIYLDNLKKVVNAMCG